MNIYPYTITCDSLTADKRQYLPDAVTPLSGVTRDNVIDVVNPVILVSSAAPINCNYAHVPDFGRYYYVTVSVIRAGLYALSMHCDVLTSHIVDIKLSPAVAKRTRNAGVKDNINVYVRDKDLPMFAYTEDCVHVIHSFSAGWTGGAYVCTVG